ncbi:MAG: DegT/DnrJ/EryC1/StrS family aminotransferase [Euryarchaeota archaeon]|nr:DegT/DnrJ/EryC1/StrS family aminotransferase [Euryarchaeota archaeon]
MPKIPLARPFYDGRDLEAVKRVLDSRWVAQGPTVTELERRFAAYCGAGHGVAVNSATSALQLALMALGVKRGDEVILPDFTFPATGNVVLFLGARPVLCDVDEGAFCMDPEDAASKVTRRTRAIIPVHILGHPAPMDELNALARERRLKVLEDAACAHGTEYRGRKAGALGDLSAFSFHARKVLSTGEGGMVLTNDGKQAELLSALRSHGMFQSAWKREQRFSLPRFDILGYNMRMSDVTAALGLSQLERLEEFIERRRALARLYDDLLSGSGLPVAPPREAPGCRHNYQTYAIRLLRKGIRDKVLLRLQAAGIGCTIGTYSLSLLPLFKGKCPRGRSAFRNTVALPLFFEMRDEEVHAVVDELKKAVNV